MTSIRTIITTGVLAASLSSCAFLAQKPTTEPSASWKESKNYYLMGDGEADAATVAFSQGNFEAAEEHLINALSANPKHPQALLVGALLYEQTGRVNRARQYYEDLILVAGDRTTILGTNGSVPQKMADVARTRLRQLTMAQNRMIIEDPNGTKIFDVSQNASSIQGRSAMEEALFAREQRLITENRASSEADLRAVEVLFNEYEKNSISRFLIMKELAEKDLITKNEFLKARMANIGALLPLTNAAPGFGVDKPVPSASVIIERIQALKDATEARAITPREFSVERNLIVEAILPPSPSVRAKNRAPARDILSAAKEMRKIEVIYDLNLITSKERDNEQRAIEKHLGLNKSFEDSSQKPQVQPIVETKPQAQTPPKSEPVISAQAIEPVTDETTSVITEELKEQDLSPKPTNLLPDITTPF